VTQTDTKKTIRSPEHNNLANILIVDRNIKSNRLILELSAKKGIHVNIANNTKIALDMLEKDDHHLIFINDSINQQNENQNNHKISFELLRKIRTSSPEMPIVMVASLENNHQQENIETAVKAVQAGCIDFITKPLQKEKIRNILDSYLPNHNVSIMASANQGNKNLYKIVGKSPKLAQSVNLAKKIAPTSIPVLVCGESGTGKELISYLIHHHSKRAHAPYIKVNCAALSDSLLESELFGHEKGAFTGAYTKRKGKFESANGGTLLLDEISETPIKFQAKLLRIIEQQNLQRVGGNENIDINIRIISTTNKNIPNLIQKGNFRLDLYYRLNGTKLILAPLRKRTEDISELIWHFVNLYTKESKRKITKLDPKMMDILKNYYWPGNIRQLRNVVLTSMILGSGETLSLADISWLFEEIKLNHQHIDENQKYDYQNVQNEQTQGLSGRSLRELEKLAILDTLKQTQGNQRKAAEVLGITDRTLRGKIKRYKQKQPMQTT